MGFWVAGCAVLFFKEKHCSCADPIITAIMVARR